MKYINELVDHFLIKYGENSSEIKTFFSPGRVNLIGEHTDYNGGHVFPCALTFGTYAVARKRNDNKVKLYSINFDHLPVVELDVNNIKYSEEDRWTNYPKGVIKEFIDLGYSFNGFEVLFYGNIPNGAGLSSSASLELATSIVIKNLYNIDIEMMNMVKLSQKAENEFVGVNCGIMDQFAIGMGKKDHAVLLDTNTLKYKYVPIKLEGISIVIGNTNKKRGLADSKYNERRLECETALKELQTELSINSLGELTEEEFEHNKHLIKDATRIKRAKHAVYENRRTLKSVKVLEEGNIDLFGKLMNESHISLRDDYEVTGKELDTLVSIAWKTDGVIGSRMTGAGFGGCTVSLVESDKVDSFIKEVGNEYEQIIGYKADFYVASIGDGTQEIN